MPPSGRRAKQHHKQAQGSQHARPFRRHRRRRHRRSATDNEPDTARSTKLAKYLLANGCDGFNVLGTTGEATSFSLDQRKRVMNAYK